MIAIIECWSCHRHVKRSEVLAADGFCPVCDAEIDEEEEGE